MDTNERRAMAEWDRICEESERWNAAEERADGANAKSQYEYAALMMADYTRCIDALSDALAGCDDAADKLRRTCARLMVEAMAGVAVDAKVRALVLTLAQEEARDNAKHYTAENFIEEAE